MRISMKLVYQYMAIFLNSLKMKLNKQEKNKPVTHSSHLKDTVGGVERPRQEPWNEPWQAPSQSIKSPGCSQMLHIDSFFEGPE